jgi:hypothetical protein
MNFPTHYYQYEQEQPYKKRKESFPGDFFDIG